MKYDTIKCPCCGASYKGRVKDDHVNCSYCNSVIVLDENIDINNEEKKREELKEKLDKITAYLKEKQLGKKVISAGTALVMAATSGYYINKNIKNLFGSSNKPKVTETRQSNEQTTKRTYNYWNRTNTAKDYSGTASHFANRSESHYQVDMTLEDYEKTVESVYSYLSGKIKYDSMMNDIKAAVYLVNYDYISDELRSELKDNHYIRGENDNLVSYISLVNHVSDYNQRTIYQDYLKGSVYYSRLADLSVACFDTYDRTVNNLMFNEWYEAFDLSEKSIGNNQNFKALYNQLYGANEFTGLSSGAEYQAKLLMTSNMLQLCSEYMLVNYDTKTLAKFFDEDELKTSSNFVSKNIINFGEAEDPDMVELVETIIYANHYLSHTSSDFIKKVLAGDDASKSVGKELQLVKRAQA